MRKVLFYLLVMIVCLVVIPALIVGPFSANEPDGDITSPPGASASKTPESTPGATHSPETHSAGSSPSPVLNKGDVLLKVYIDEKDTIEEMVLEDYIKGVVLGEMPLDFELEALKAQAVVARTYAYRRIFNNDENEDHPGALVCTDSNHCQAWSDPNALSANSKSKLNEAVESTEGIIITYNNKPIDALYHSNSGGMTEDAHAVWSGSPIPYLVSVKSDGETDAEVFKTIYEIPEDKFIEILENEYDDIELDNKNVFENIKNIERSNSNRITKIVIGNKVMTGRDLRRIFDLRSTNMWFSNKTKGIITITTYGNGHGVGLSQYGAKARAQEGKSFSEILKYYYKDVAIEKIY